MSHVFDKCTKVVKNSHSEKDLPQSENLFHLVLMKEKRLNSDYFQILFLLQNYWQNGLFESQMWIMFHVTHKQACRLLVVFPETDDVLMKPQRWMISGIWGILQNKLFLSSALFLFVCYQAIKDWKDFVVVMWLDGNLSCICVTYFQNWMREELLHNLRTFWLKGRCFPKNPVCYLF